LSEGRPEIGLVFGYERAGAEIPGSWPYAAGWLSPKNRKAAWLLKTDGLSV